MFKKVLTIIICIGVIFTLTACGNNKEELTDAKKFKEEYESLNGTKRESDGEEVRSIEISEDNPFVYKEASDIVKMINEKETFIVYFGFANCPWCRSVIPTLIEVAADLEIETIYYVDIKEIRDVLSVDSNRNIVTEKEGSDDYYKLIELLSNVLEDYTLTTEDNEEITANEKRIYAPNVVSVVNGEAVKMETGISEKQTTPNMKLTKEMKKETYNKFECSIKCVVENKTTCSKKTAC